MPPENLEKRIDNLEEKLERILLLFQKTQLYKKSDPEIALLQARKSAEAICKQIYIHDGLEKKSKPGKKMMLDELISVFEKKHSVPKYISINLRTIQAFGNFGSHDQGEDADFVNESSIQPCLEALATVVSWYFQKYHKKEITISDPHISTNTIVDHRLNCEYCGNMISDDWDYCPHCEAPLKLVCPECHSEVKSGWKICPKCKFKLNTDYNEKKTNEPILTDPITGMEFVFVPGGSFLMGDVFNEGYITEKPIHEVELDSFYLGKFPVTQKQWVHIMKNNPSAFCNRFENPIESISWFKIQDFIKYMNEINNIQWTFRLPTEAEWEYAARSGGKKERFSGTSNDIDSVAWYSDNSNSSTMPVGLKEPNDLGIYDMSGNISEWCLDSYRVDAYLFHEKKNPVNLEKSSNKIFRGGSWTSDIKSLRCTQRFIGLPDHKSSNVGFRLICLPKNL